MFITRFDNFKQDHIFGVAGNSGMQNVVVTSGLAYRKFPFNNLAVIQQPMSKQRMVKHWKEALLRRLVKKKGNIVEMVEK